VLAGEETRQPVYAIRRNGWGKTMANITACAKGNSPSYEVEGSYARRCCMLYDGERRAVAEVRPSPKEVVGTDVFRLVVHPDVVSLAMAVVVALEQMFARPSLLRSWSTA
jgi:hypothetical protein